MEKKHTDKINKVKQFGYYSKGLVYGLIGVLAAMAAFGLGGDIKGKSGIVNFITSLPAGEVLSAVIALGLAAYSIWRFYSAIVDPDGDGSNKRIRSRVIYAYSGVLYLIVAFSFAKPILNMQSSSGGSSKKAALSQLMDKDWGIYAIWLIASLMAGNAIWQFYIGYSGKYMKKVDENLNGKEYTIVKRSGKYGYFARGIVFGILSFFMIKVCLSHSSEAYKGTEGALKYLLSLEYGPILMGTVAIGMIGYGVFCMMVARHSNLTQ